MAIRNLRYDGDPILRKRCREVGNVDDRTRSLLEDMAQTMYSTENGGGLAACQVGVLRRLVVIDVGSGLIKLVNPVIVGTSGLQERLEGCLSFPNRWGKVIRPQKVTVQALDENGKEILLTGVDELAQCLCHEIDHLDGIVFVDKVVEWMN